MIAHTTFKFLKDLSENNNRDWFLAHKATHDTARNNVLDFTGQIIKELSGIDPAIPADMDPKNCVMRIYRDIRFSTDKTPYKSNFGVAISPNGKNFNGPGYYLHISPKQCFIAGGCWMPEAERLKAIRQEIDYNGADFCAIVENSVFKDYFGGLDTEAKLKTVPKGYSADHPYIDYLKLKSFTVSHEIRPEELLNADAVKKVADGFRKLYLFIVFLRNAIVS